MLLLFIKEAFLLSYLRLLLLFEVLIVTFLKKGFFHFAELVIEVLTFLLSSSEELLIVLIEELYFFTIGR